MLSLSSQLLWVSQILLHVSSQRETERWTQGDMDFCWSLYDLAYPCKNRSVNEIICHGIPDKRELIAGDICNGEWPHCHVSVTWLITWLVARAVDISVYHDGFHGDLNETMFVGKVDDRSQKLVQTAYECMMAGIRMGKHIRTWKQLWWVLQSLILSWLSIPMCVRVWLVHPGVRYREVGSAIQRTAQNNGFSVVRTYCGHGINQ